MGRQAVPERAAAASPAVSDYNGKRAGRDPPRRAFVVTGRHVPAGCDVPQWAVAVFTSASPEAGALV